MPRPRRLTLPGATYHIIMRGNQRMPLFQNKSDRWRYYQLLEEGVERFEHRILAFCLMSNHIHLAIQVKEVPLSQICHNLNSRYSRFYNYKYQTTGHVFESRFKSFLVDDQSYFKTLVRYIHLNPVKAGLAERPEHFEWSSHRAYLRRQDLPWLSAGIGLSRFGVLPDGDLRPYEQFVLAGIGHENAFDFDSGTSILDLNAIVKIIEGEYSNGSEGSISDTKLCALSTILARKTKGIGIDQVAEHFGKKPNALRKAASRLQSQIHTSADLQAELNNLWQKLLPA